MDYPILFDYPLLCMILPLCVVRSLNSSFLSLSTRDFFLEQLHYPTTAEVVRYINKHHCNYNITINYQQRLRHREGFTREWFFFSKEGTEVCAISDLSMGDVRCHVGFISPKNVSCGLRHAVLSPDLTTLVAECGVITTTLGFDRVLHDTIQEPVFDCFTVLAVMLEQPISLITIDRGEETMVLDTIKERIVESVRSPPTNSIYRHHYATLCGNYACVGELDTDEKRLIKMAVGEHHLDSKAITSIQQGIQVLTEKLEGEITTIVGKRKEHNKV